MALVLPRVTSRKAKPKFLFTINFFDRFSFSFFFSANATCDNVTCGPDEKCLVHRESGLPRCTYCYDCREGPLSPQIKHLLCGNNNQTYQTWCDMRNDSCRTGYVIEAQYSGSCELGNTKIEKSMGM